jgi:hypothetical protein
MCFVVDHYLIGRGNRRGGREVGVRDILAKHAVGVEEGAVDGNAMAAHFSPTNLVGVERGNGILEFVVETTR